MTPLDELMTQPVVIVAGKGGVGKTTVTAALANAAAAAGSRVLAVELDSRPQLAALLPDVETLTIEPSAALEEYLVVHGFGRTAKRLLRTGVIDLVATATPGIDDVVVLGKIKQLALSGNYDTILVDGPAAGRALSFLTAPEGLLNIARSGPINRQAREVADLLSDPERCGVVLVTVPETTPVSELIQAAFDTEDRAGVTLNGIVVNQVWPNPIEAGTSRKTAAPKKATARNASGLASASEFMTERIGVQTEAMDRLRDRLALPCVRLPMLAGAGLVADDIGELVATADACEADAGFHTSHDAVDADSATGGSGPAEGDLAELIDDHRVVLCVGPGGVGKTTTAAALGLAAAKRGRRVVVVTIDPARRLADALGMPDGLTSEPVRLAQHISESGELWAMMLDPAAMLARVVARFATDASQVDRITENRFFRQIATNLGGTQDYMASEALYELAEDERFDLVIVDTPPSRQTLGFLESPGVLTRFLSHRLFRLMMLPTRTSLRLVSDASGLVLRQIGRIIGSDLLTDATAFFQAFAGMEEGFRERAAATEGVLRADSTVFVLASSPNDDVIAESRWFANRLGELGFGVGAMVMNRTMPRFESRRSKATDANTLWLNTIGFSQRRVSKGLDDVAPIGVTVPLLAGDVHDLDGLEIVARHLVTG